jgi:capsular exopolysaccharide synthesis family protein
MTGSTKKPREQRIVPVDGDGMRPDLPLNPSEISIYARSAEEVEENPLLLAYWGVIVKRRWTIMSLAAISVVVTAAITWNFPQLWRATIKLQIDPEQASLLPFKETLEHAGTYAQSQEYLQTQFRVLSSNTLAERVIQVLDLKNDPDFAQQVRPRFTSRTMNWLWTHTLGRPDQGDAWTRERPQLTERFLENLTVDPVRNSRLVQVSFDASDPALAARVLNCLAEQYIELGFETRYEATNKASRFLTRQLDDLKAKVERSEEELVRFSKEHDIYSVGEKENVILQKLSDLNGALTSAQAERIQKESNWNIVQNAKEGTFPEELRTDLIRELERDVAKMRRDQARLSASFKPGWPELDQVTEQLAQGEAQLVEEYAKTIERIQTEYQAAMERERLLTAALEAQKLEANRLNQDSIEYNIRKREVETNKQLYDGLLQHLKGAAVSAGLRSSNVHVVDPAQPPVRPFRPNKVLNLSLGLAIGLLLGIAGAFSMEHLDRSIRSQDDVECGLGLPSLGMIPLVSKRREIRALPRRGGARSTAATIDLIAHQDARSLVSEAYRNVRTSIQLSSNGYPPPRVLLITSSFQREGKTATSINLAEALAQNGQRVILLECDLRNPRMHRAMGIHGADGMSSFLAGGAELGGLIRPSSVPNLYCITAGRIPSNPAELISAQRMREGLNALQEHFDNIIIDSPPLLPVTDARILATLVDGVILVIRADVTPRGVVLQSKRLLKAVHAPLLGAILNGVDMFGPGRYRYAQYYSYVASCASENAGDGS